MRILVGSASPSTCLATAPDSCMARDPGCEFIHGAPDARPEPARALGIREAPELDRGARVGLQLLDEPEQRRLSAIAQLGLVEAEVDVHAVGDLALVAIAPQPREPAVDAIRLGE